MPVSNKKSMPGKHPQSAGERLASALTQYTKIELIELFVRMAEDECAIMRWLEWELGMEKPSEEVVTETRQAIAKATEFDERDSNRNFDYDYESYLVVERNFKTLTDSGQIAMAMTLAGELMERGSYQVEMSDEGLMTQDIEQCLNVVIKALKKKGTRPASDVVEWCATMTERDRVGFISDSELQTLRKRFEVG